MKNHADQAAMQAIASGLTLHADRVSKAKAHRREKARKRRRVLRNGNDGNTVRADKDYLIRAHECKVVRLDGDFGSDPNKEWFIEKRLLAGAEDTFFSVANTLVTTRKPAIPVSNLSDSPRYIRKGEILGERRDPTAYFDAPRSPEELTEMRRKAALITAVTNANLDWDKNGPRPPKKSARSTTRDGPRVRTDFGSGVPPMEENIYQGVHIRTEDGRVPNLESESDNAIDDSEDYGPKTAAMPDNTIYPSSRMKDLLDIGTLPDHLKEEAWNMLERRIDAFGFDGRLGHLKAKARIRTKDDQEPIAVPMYGSSPEKRRVIDEQLDKWFELGVIEPSVSPWSAPVVIAYRNGKPRFCVDYRKLNAVTIPDEFPIPRQPEILSALSGSQVMSCLDALARFTQMEMADEDVEKTAFRTHRGLAQFRRMPFGLRNGPSIFQRVMQGILAPYLWIFCLVYIDDIVVFSKTYEDHIEHLDKVLGAIAQAGVTLSPTKCHLFYSSILLLGHKVSRLGLSTHLEKVRAILELERPRKLSQLQGFLGMAVYFSSFIPYYADICKPLFQLLRKGSKWEWGSEQEFAFKAIKEALQNSPVRGHPIEGRPYRLYTDASDDAAGVALQQIQPILVKDLKGTRAYLKLRKAYDAGLPPPRLTVKLSSKIDDNNFEDVWGSSFDESIVHVERVIGYWSRSFKGAETRYSTTEREALAAKEGLVRFQPFIEGEKVILVTDHSALQWARTYENSNRRLAAWGVVFSAYAPHLEIVHRAGRTHSNVDPLSRLPRAPPEHHSPRQEDERAIAIADDLAEGGSAWSDRPPAERATFVAWTLDDCLEGRKSAFALTRSQKKAASDPATVKEPTAIEAGGGNTRPHLEPESAGTLNAEPEMPIPLSHEDRTPAERPDDLVENDELDALEATKEYWGATHRPPNLNIGMDAAYKKEFVADYQRDPWLKRIWNDKDIAEGRWKPGQRFFKNEEGLLFFRDADYQPRLCVPQAKVLEIMTEAHESPMESAHVSPERLWTKLSTKFYWRRMKKDLQRFGETCDVCQKIKNRNFTRYGYLIPNPIPTRPYQSVSMDLIVNLPWSGEYNAIFVVVDRLSKHASFIPTTSGLSAEGFTDLFVQHIVARFGIPDSIIADRDPRWTSDFWRAVATALKTRMSLSSSHHPQHDGQTENVNRQLETMLRAYVSKDKSDWAEWLKILEFACNSSVHGSIGTTPFSLLYGFDPKTPLDFLLPGEVGYTPAYGMSKESSEYLERLRIHRENARLSIARAQDEQSKHHNKGRKDVPEFKIGSKVLINPHSLEWLESKGEGSKLVQRWIGPFEVIQRINPRTYRVRLEDKYPGFPVFNLDHLKPYKESSPELGPRTTMPDTREHKLESEEYEVEKVVGDRYDKRRRTKMYLVRWKNYGPQFDTWQTHKDLRNAPEMLREYAKSKAKRG